MVKKPLIEFNFLGRRSGRNQCPVLGRLKLPLGLTVVIVCELVEKTRELVERQRDSG